MRGTTQSGVVNGWATRETEIGNGIKRKPKRHDLRTENGRMTKATQCPTSINVWDRLRGENGVGTLGIIGTVWVMPEKN